MKDFAEQCRLAKFRNSKRKEAWRRPGAWKQDVAWAYLRKHPGCKSGEVAVALGITLTACAKLLRRMKDRGYAKDSGKRTKGNRWWAGKSPECRWGTNPNSEPNLAVGWKRWPQYLSAATVARGLEPSMLLRSGLTREESARQLGRGGIGAPSEIVRIPTLAEMLGIKDAA